MPLVVHSVEHADVTQCINLRVTTLGSLVIGRPPPYPGYVEEAEASVHSDLDNSPHVRHLKVMDTENQGEIIAYAKWEMYKHGRSDTEKLSKLRENSEIAKEKKEQIDQFGKLRAAAHEYFSMRNGEMGKKPHLLLALLVTSEQHRRHGAGSLLVRWGIEMSERTGLVCYLQASAQGRRLYAYYGFEDIDTVEFNLEEYGLKGMEQMTEMIRKPSVKADHEVVGSA